VALGQQFKQLDQDAVIRDNRAQHRCRRRHAAKVGHARSDDRAHPADNC